MSFNHFQAPFSPRKSDSDISILLETSARFAACFFKIPTGPVRLGNNSPFSNSILAFAHSPGIY